MKLLLTAFDPFGGEATNPSGELLAKLDLERLRQEGLEVDRLVVPTVFGKSAKALIRALESAHYDAVLCLGQAGGRTALSLERVAINLMEARIADNEGQRPVDEAVVEGGPVAYFSTLPLKSMLQEMRRVGVPATLSTTAGTFVCNQLMYVALHWCAEHRPNCQAGFLHLPYLPEQVVMGQAASMSLEEMKKGLEAGLLGLVRPQEDPLLSEGSLH